MKTYNYKYENGDLNDSIDFTLFKEEKNILVQIFCGQNKNILKLLTDVILDRIPQAICIGTTTDGEINNSCITTAKSVISISIFQNTHIKTSYVEDKDAFKSGEKLASNLITQNTKLLILFTDGTETNAEDFLKGIESYNSTIPICGGMAGDNGTFKQTYISSQKHILKEGVVGVSLNSDVLKVATDYKFDWKAIGVEHIIDKVDGNRIYKIDGITPVAFYEKYLGSNISQTEFPFIIEKNGVLTARAVIAKHEDGSLSCAGNLNAGDKVRIGFGDAKSLLRNPTKVLKNLKKINTETFYIYSCMARRRYMPDLIKLEIEPFSNIAPTSGFFSYSEFYHNNGHNELLNQTMTVVALSESEVSIKVENNREQNISINEEESSYIKTIESLTNLIQQSTRDYDIQSKKLEEQMNYSKNLLTSHKQFLRYTVHEMNTPLNVITGNIELHEMMFSKNVYLENIEVAVKSVFSLYDDLSYLVKKDQLHYLKRKIDVVDYVRSRIDFFAQVANKAKSKFIFETNCEELPIYFNETKLQRIIDNNLTNAIKYTFANKDIIVSIKRKEDDCEFSISSHSRKIQKPEKVFEEYYREESSQDGFGLGLNLVKKICIEEKVKINLKSNEKSTTFNYVFNVDKR